MGPGVIDDAELTTHGQFRETGENSFGKNEIRETLLQVIIFLSQPLVRWLIDVCDSIAFESFWVGMLKCASYFAV